MPNLYEILQLDPSTATQNEIRLAYRKAVKTVHPDSGGDPEDFSVVQNAYDTLSDAKKKKRYDASLSVVKGNPKITKRGNPSWDTSQMYQSYDAFTRDELARQWAAQAQSNVQPFGSQGNSTVSQRQPRTATVLQKDIIGGKIERSPDIPMQYGDAHKDWYIPMPPSRITANIDIVLNRGNDHLRSLLPGDRVTMSYNGLDIDMTLMSYSIRNNGNGNILMSMELVK